MVYVSDSFTPLHNMRFLLRLGWPEKNQDLQLLFPLESSNLYVLLRIYLTYSSTRDYHRKFLLTYDICYTNLFETSTVNYINFEWLIQS